MRPHRHSEKSDSADDLEIAIRAYVPTGRTANKWRGSDLGPSEWALIFDTETTTDASQALKFGVYQVRKAQELWEAGFFVNPAILTAREIAIIRGYAAEINYRCMTVGEFVENVFFKIGYDLRALIIGFNPPFDISRLAIYHGASPGRVMKGGFSFRLSPHRYWPNIQIKHLSARVSLIRFTTRPGRIAGRGMRRRKFRIPPQPGYFIDVRTFAAAMTSRSFSLAGSADFLGTETRKLETHEHGKSVTRDYLVYAKQDVQVTWECFCALRRKFDEHNFTQTRPHKVFSEASIGKAYFKEMNIRSWRERQPNFPEYLTGIILSTYSGGRSEVHHRRIISQVAYCDFLSMYPTVCTLMGLWKFVISNGLKWRESREEIVALLGSVTLSDLRDPKFWSKLTVLVQISPDDDVLPVRANYGGEQQTTLGQNYVTTGSLSLWYTLADAIASKLRTGRAPKVLRAITFEPDGVQDDLRPVNICGNPDYRIKPCSHDFYCRVIDLRSAVKLRKASAPAHEQAALNSAQLSLKIIANSMSYGNFVELNVEHLPKAEEYTGFSHCGEPFKVTTDKIEEPGRYFHPLIGTLITGAARLMLAVTERLVIDQGLDWAFCDTDSMAIAKPADIDMSVFNAKVEAVRAWFDGLNPYTAKNPILKLEDANFGIADGKCTAELEPLYCWAISAKRYALFNIASDGQIIIRKASAHGLGHLLAPYIDPEAPSAIPAPKVGLDEIGVERWQYDYWHQIIWAALGGHPDQVDLDYHPKLDISAASRYGASTPNLLTWFSRHNEDRPYDDQVRPSNFLLAYQINPAAIHKCPEFLASITDNSSSKAKTITLPKPVAPYHSDPAKAADKCFDRDTGVVIPPSVLKTYKDALAQYHLRPEHKFLNGSHADRGITRRRHVRAIAVRYIGKESNRWEEQYYLGADDGADIRYRPGSQEPKPLLGWLRERISEIGQRRAARESGVARRTVERLMQGKTVRDIVLEKMFRFLDGR
jgi:hypothetical protein